MIRFIDLGDQITDDAREFAWFNTISDEFMRFSETSVWSSWSEFRTDVFSHSRSVGDFQKRMERFTGLAPRWAKEAK